MTRQAYPAPQVTPESADFYAAAAEGRFMIGRCTDTGKPFWYPRAVSPFTFGPTTLMEASGRGMIYSYSVMRRANPPATIAYVTLEEGPTMMTSLVDCDLEALHVGQAVHLVWVPTEGGPPVPCFTTV